MAKIVKRPAAEQDLIDIYLKIAAEAPSRAKPFLERIYQKLDLLSDNPLIGARRLLSYPEIRGFPIGNYVILYRPLVDQTGIEVIRVFHGARDWHNLVDDDMT